MQQLWYKNDLCNHVAAFSLFTRKSGNFTTGDSDSDYNFSMG